VHIRSDGLNIRSAEADAQGSGFRILSEEELDAEMSREEQARLVEQLAIGREGLAYLDGHRDALTARYPDQWVAVHRDRVIAAAATSSEIAAAIRGDDGEVVTEYLHRVRPILTL
jgi:hypothetical protein